MVVVEMVHPYVGAGDGTSDLSVMIGLSADVEKSADEFAFKSFIVPQTM